MPQTTNKQPRVWNLSMILLGLYVLFNYIAQETLLPPVIHSAVMYAYIGYTAFTVLLSGKVKLTYYTVWYFVFLAFSALSMLWATKAETGALFNMVVALILTFCVLNTVNSLERLEAIMMVFVLAAVVMGIMLAATDQLILEEGERLGQEITGNANSFSVMLMISGIFSGWFVVYRRGFLKFFNLAALIFLLFLMALSGGRKYLLVAVICVVWFVISKDTKSFVRIFSGIVKATAVLWLLYLAIMNIPLIYDSIGMRFEEMFNMFSGGESAVAGDDIRQRLIEIGLKQWSYSPLWGYGMDTFKHYNKMVTGYFYYAHNNYVELLYDLGLLGTVLYYWFYGHAIKKLATLPRTVREYKILGIGMLVGLLIFEFGGVSYNAVFVQLALSIIYSIVLCAAKTKKENS